MASFVTSENAIVNDLNARKKDYVDKGMFVVSTEELTEELTKEYNAIQQATKAGSSVYNSVYAEAKSSSNIKLLILELTGNTLTLDCNAFLLDADRMNEQYIESLNHVIVGKTGKDAYAVIGYVESAGSSSRPGKPCTSFKLNLEGNPNTCALLPEIIKNIIFQCITQHYNDENKEPPIMEKYYNPVRADIVAEVEEETKVEADLAAAQAAAEIKEADKCDFKALLKSKIKNESNEYCKVTDPGLLERIKQNIDGNKVDVNVDGLNELINTRIKKVTDEDEEDEEEKEREDGKKTISENKEATMIREANEMYMISRKELSKGATYSSSDFFKEYLTTNVMVNEQEVKEAKLPVIEAPALVAEAPPEAPAAAPPVAPAPVIEQDVPGPKEVIQQPNVRLREAAKKVIKPRAKPPKIDAFTYAPIQAQNHPA